MVKIWKTYLNGNLTKLNGETTNKICIGIYPNMTVEQANVIVENFKNNPEPNYEYSIETDAN